MIDTRLLGPDDTRTLDTIADDVFDHPIDPDRLREFLADPRHHLAVAIDRDVVVGFASAVHYVHPDKPRPEMWINEVGVAPTYRRRGLGRRVVDLIIGRARETGCSGVWVIADADNTAAASLYRSAQLAASPKVSTVYDLTLDHDGLTTPRP